jgi:hypothetical protein
MGLLGKIFKGVKSIVKGVVKVFKKAVSFVGKISGSKWGKILMLVAAVYTGGMALSAGMSTFGSTAGGFMTKFVAGAKEFMGVLAHPIAAAQKSLGGAAAGAGAAGEAASIAPVTAAAGVPAEGLAGAVGGAAEAAAPAVAAAAPGVGGGAGLLGQAGGVASKVGGGLLNFAKSTGGGMVLAKGLEGYAQGKAAEAQLKEQRRMTGPMAAGAISDINAHLNDMQTPQGFLDRARSLNQSLTRPQYPQTPGAPEQVYGDYVTQPQAAGG